LAFEPRVGIRRVVVSASESNLLYFVFAGYNVQHGFAQYRKQSEIVVFDVGQGREVVRLFGPTIPATAALGLSGGRVAIAFGYSGRLARNGSDSGLSGFSVVDTLEQKAIAELEGHQGRINAICQLPGRRFASASLDGSVRIWNETDWKEALCMDGHGGEVTALALLTNEILASGSTDRAVRLWSLKDGIEIARLDLDAPIYSLAAGDRCQLVAGDELGRLHWLEALV
jgi:WD40 repeat protein